MASNFFDVTKPLGGIVALIEYKDRHKTPEVLRFPNVVLNRGRMTLAGFLAGQLTQQNIFVKNMLFGDGGYDHQQGLKRNVDSDRNSLFGVTRVSKPVVAQIDPMVPTQAIFTAVITFEEANGSTLNEMALQLSDQNFFSMATFPDLGKTNQMQITWNWRLSFV
jgi:hypothetical protein